VLGDTAETGRDRNKPTRETEVLARGKHTNGGWTVKGSGRPSQKTPTEKMSHSRRGEEMKTRCKVKKKTKKPLHRQKTSGNSKKDDGTPLGSKLRIGGTGHQWMGGKEKRGGGGGGPQRGSGIGETAVPDTDLNQPGYMQVWRVRPFKEQKGGEEMGYEGWKAEKKTAREEKEKIRARKALVMRAKKGKKKGGWRKKKTTRSKRGIVPMGGRGRSGGKTGEKRIT